MKEGKILWHKYPDENPPKDGFFTDYENKPNRICSIIAWAEKPEPYKEENHE